VITEGRVVRQLQLDLGVDRMGVLGQKGPMRLDPERASAPQRDPGEPVVLPGVAPQPEVLGLPRGELEPELGEEVAAADDPAGYRDRPSQSA
jgi:hypothetical protein